MYICSMHTCICTSMHIHMHTLLFLSLSLSGAADFSHSFSIVRTERKKKNKKRIKQISNWVLVSSVLFMELSRSLMCRDAAMVWGHWAVGVTLPGLSALSKFVSSCYHQDKPHSSFQSLVSTYTYLYRLHKFILFVIYTTPSFLSFFKK
jgi:hypothetical protein